MKFKPKSKKELETVIKEIITKQNKDRSYPYGLKDIDVSLITNMSNLFTNDKGYSENYEINRQIDWNYLKKNSIIDWDVSNVTDMSGMFHKSKINQDISNWNIKNVTNMSWFLTDSKFFIQDISKWIFTLNRNCNLDTFNYFSKHSKKYGKINSYEDFIERQLTENFIKDIFKNGNDIEKFKLLKIIKKYPDIIKDLNININIKL